MVAWHARVGLVWRDWDLRLHRRFGTRTTGWPTSARITNIGWRSALNVLPKRISWGNHGQYFFLFTILFLNKPKINLYRWRWFEQEGFKQDKEAVPSQRPTWKCIWSAASDVSLKPRQLPRVGLWTHCTNKRWRSKRTSKDAFCRSVW